jgi:hypothetical protein
LWHTCSAFWWVFLSFACRIRLQLKSFDQQRQTSANMPKFCRLSRRVWVIATLSMLARCMIILYMRGAYSTPLNVYSAQ